MLTNILNFLNENMTVVGSLCGIVLGAALSFLIQRYFFNKNKYIQDFELINKYFINDKRDKFKGESNIVKDMLCNTVSIFKGLSFEQACSLLDNKNIRLNDIKNIIELYKEGYLNPYYQRNKNYKTRINSYINALLWLLIFFIYCIAILAFMLMMVNLKLILDDTILNLLMILLIFPAEIFLLSHIEKIFSIKNKIKWFHENEQRLKSNLILNN